ncbi:MAG: RNA polymerase sigma factor FliA [Candidatus Sedimenticola endophacoides]|uniref:RNA polymerase sigma factor FliA n=1 Tax=Candidatus Sedimenticola endophacoides TaxID=2548426 RepID=A0A657PUK5_9GAMM|nr:MAG: RNA polymerase sigma factor FliA [Candidatus Sedimenticola endophacoides]OQX33009.1 MAG: RNA polymerase sigma factor FliA [Candidatus Sedimenticola endophacoides]OQX39226.1 MAG: RNA polymerase sigma factor FliA [Candidatus Sedimenticola endophacoides]OQX43568.1 MAG: RNA polymerase sigma factor FliA [Candidatus Sedimenticola endophacoides]OQX45392.1 MAG: RNA polymerase sigma factor FliA [Candidatus Sedimenticola endophacoides]
MSGVASYTAVQDQDSLVTRHALLVKRIAYHLMNRLPPSVQVDDLIQSGMIGLLEAGRNYDPSQGASFETYAGIRIRGAMLDEIRRSDWTPRSVHRKARQVAEVMRRIENEVGRDARDVEVADALEMSLEEYHRILLDASSSRLFSVDELQSVGELPQRRGENNGADALLDNVQHDEFRHSLADAIAGLPDRERLVMSLYYDEELNLREIGKVLGVSESRVCQIHSQAALRLRARLADWLTRADEP